jgi:hypothetical protein
MTGAELAHADIELLLGAFVLHAVDPDEFELIGRHLETCPRCSAEVDDRNEIAAALGNVPAVVPEQLWERIAGRLEGPVERPADADWVVAGRDNVVRIDEIASSSDRRVRAAGATRRATRLSRFSFAAVVAAAAVIALLAVGLTSANGRLARDQSALARQSVMAQVDAALASPGHQIVQMSSGTDANLAEFVVSDGIGYAVRTAMPTLPANETYQLWASIGGQPISLGLLGDHPQPGAAFSLRSERGGSVVLLITVEPAGGVVVPDRAPVAASGKVVDV